MNSRIFLGLGSNLADRLRNLHEAIALLECRLVKQSSVYETEPVGYLHQPWFLNMVIQIETDLTPRELLKRCQEIEKKLKRQRVTHKGPRTVDLDILFYDNVVCSDADLILPHPAISQRRFVLIPMNEIVSDFVHPVLQKTIRELLESCEDHSIVNLFS